MLVQKIIQESIDKNPLGMKEVLESELRDRIRLALEAKVAESEHEDEDDDDEDDDDAEDEDHMKEAFAEPGDAYLKQATQHL